MIAPQIPTCVEVTDENAAKFIQTLHDTLKEMTRTQREEVRLIVQKQQAVAISVDSKNRPFLGYTAGYNQPDSRTALPIDDPVLYEIRKWLLMRRKAGPRGGRVFLTSDRVFTVPENDPIILCTWEWPREDLVKEVLSLLELSLYW